MIHQSKAVFKYALALVFLFTHAVSYAGAPAGNDVACSAAISKSNVKPCKDAIAAAKSVGADGAKTTDLKAGADESAATSAVTGALTEEGRKQCQKVYDGCKDVCAGTAKETDCSYFKKFAEELAAGTDQNLQNQIDSQATSDAAGAQPQSTGGGLGEMMPMLMGAGIGGLMGYMMAKKMNEDKDKEDKAIDGALLPTGQLDCSKDDAYMYGECNAWLEANCAGVKSPACNKFSLRYCGSDPKDVKASGGFVGEGIGTPFCKNAQAVAFCKVQGRGMCPSCLGLARQDSAACQQDPSLCLAQNSTDQIEEAKKTCPTDPAFSDPAYVAGGGSQVPGGLNDGSLPAVVLPQSVGANAAQAVKDAKSAGISTQSVGGAASGAVAGSTGDGAVVEGGANGTAGAANGSGSYGSGSYGTPSTGGGRNVASTKGGVNYRTASAEGRPSDVAGPFGPSLFKTSTEVIKGRCDAGKFNNCP